MFMLGTNVLPQLDSQDFLIVAASFSAQWTSDRHKSTGKVLVLLDVLELCFLLAAIFVVFAWKFVSRFADETLRKETSWGIPCEDNLAQRTLLVWSIELVETDFACVMSLWA